MTPTLLNAIIISEYLKGNGVSLSDNLSVFLKSKGADIVGYADLREFHHNIRHNFPFGISIGVALEPSIVSVIVDGPTPAYYHEYLRVNDLLDILGQSAAEFIRRNGGEARNLGVTHGHNPATLATPLPHKTVATRAGLGWIGKCALLVTREFGSAVRITTVLTDAEVAAGEPVDSSQCGDCVACVAACPGHAPSGNNWQPDLPRDSFFNAFACRNTALALAMKRTGHREIICGRCIVACPWTQKYLERAR